MSLRELVGRGGAPPAPAVPPIDRLFSEIGIGSRVKKLQQKAQQSDSLKPKGIVKQNQKQPDQIITYPSLYSILPGKAWGVPPEEILSLIDTPPMVKPIGFADATETAKVLRALVVAVDQNGDGAIDASDVARMQAIGGQPFNDAYALLETVDFQNDNAAKMAAFEDAAPDWRQGTPEAAAVASNLKATLLEVFPDLAIHGVLVQEDLQSLLACVASPVDAASRMKAKLMASDAIYTEQAAALDWLISTTAPETQRYIQDTADGFLPVERGLRMAEIATGVPLTKAVDAALLCDAARYPVSGPDDVDMNAALYVLARASYPLDDPRGIEDPDLAYPPGAGLRPAQIAAGLRPAQTLPPAHFSMTKPGGRGDRDSVWVQIITSHGAHRLTAKVTDPFYVTNVKSEDGKVMGDRCELASFFHMIGGLLDKGEIPEIPGGGTPPSVQALTNFKIPWRSGPGRGEPEGLSFLEYVKCQMIHDETPTQALVKSFAAAVRKYWKRASVFNANDRANTALAIIDQMVTGGARTLKTRPVASKNNITPDEIDDNGRRIAVMVEYVTAIVECASATGTLKLETNLYKELWKNIVKRSKIEGSGSYLYNPQGLPNPAKTGQYADSPDIVRRLESAYTAARQANPAIKGTRDRLRVQAWDDMVESGASFPHMATAQSRADAAARNGPPNPSAQQIRADHAKVPQKDINAGVAMGKFFKNWKVVASMIAGQGYLGYLMKPVSSGPDWWPDLSLVNRMKCSWKTGSMISQGFSTCLTKLSNRERLVYAENVVKDGLVYMWETLSANLRLPARILEGLGVGHNTANWVGTGATFAAYLATVYASTRWGYPGLKSYWRALTATWSKDRIQKALIDEFKERFEAAEGEERTRLQAIEVKLKELYPGRL